MVAVVTFLGLVFVAVMQLLGIVIGLAAAAMIILLFLVLINPN